MGMRERHEKQRQRRMTEKWLKSLHEDHSKATMSLFDPSGAMILLGEPADTARLTASLAEAHRYLHRFRDGDDNRWRFLMHSLNLIKTDLLWRLNFDRYRNAVDKWGLTDNSDLIRGARQHDPPIWVVISPGGPTDAFTHTMHTKSGQVIVFSQAMLWLADRLCCLLATTGPPEIINEYAPGAETLSSEQAQADFRAALAAAESSTFTPLPVINMPDNLIQLKDSLFEAMCDFMIAHELAHLFLGHQRFGQHSEFSHGRYPKATEWHSEEYLADCLGALMLVDRQDAESKPAELAIWGVIMTFELLHQIELYRSRNALSDKERRTSARAKHPHPVLRQTSAITYVQKDVFDGDWNLGFCDAIAASLMNITGRRLGEPDCAAREQILAMSDADTRKEILIFLNNMDKIGNGVKGLDLRALNPLIDESLQRAISAVASAAAIYVGYIGLDCWVISGTSQITLGYLYLVFQRRYLERSPTLALPPSERRLAKLLVQLENWAVDKIAELDGHTPQMPVDEAVSFDATLRAAVPDLAHIVKLLERSVLVK